MTFRISRATPQVRAPFWPTRQTRSSICVALSVAIFVACTSAAPSFAAQPATQDQPTKQTQPKKREYLGPPPCEGKNLLTEFKADHPKKFAKIEADAAKIKNAEALLWKIEKPGTPPSHLMGTVHLTDPRVNALPPETVKALSESTTVALELAEITAKEQMKAVAANPQLMTLSDGRTLTDILPLDVFNDMVEKLKPYGYSAVRMKLLRPWVFYGLLATPPCEQARMMLSQPTVDMTIGLSARKQNIPVVGLETLEFQANTMIDMPDEEKIKLIRSSLALFDRANDLQETMISLYLERKLNVIVPLYEDLLKLNGIDESGMASMLNTLVVERNKSMLKTSLPLLEKGKAFIAVGALHLIDETGLVALYRKAGYKVTPVN